MARGGHNRIPLEVKRCYFELVEMALIDSPPASPSAISIRSS